MGAGLSWPCMGEAWDTLGRPLRDLRISLTDRCNMRCGYCMPREVFGEGFEFLPRSELLSFEEIARFVGVAARLGVHKVRLTGGEPLLRRDTPRLVGMLSSIEGITDIALTTNGLLLARHAAALKRAGLDRVTVSLDTLDEDLFASISDTRAPLAARAARHRGGGRGRPRAGEGEHGRPPWGQRRLRARDGRALPRTPRDPQVHRVHGRGREQRVAPRGGRAGAGDPRHGLTALAAAADPRRTPGRRGLALGLRGWGEGRSV